jgi:hypothetical protein
LPVKIEAALFWVQPYHWWVQTQWRAPEVFEDEENRDKHTISSGVDSFAIILFVVLNGKVPTNVLQSICDSETGVFQMWNSVLITFLCSLRNVGPQML